jgi:hypothetical protein
MGGGGREHAPGRYVYICDKCNYLDHVPTGDSARVIQSVLMSRDKRFRIPRVRRLKLQFPTALSHNLWLPTPSPSWRKCRLPRLARQVVKYAGGYRAIFTPSARPPGFRSTLKLRARSSSLGRRPGKWP